MFVRKLRLTRIHQIDPRVSAKPSPRTTGCWAKRVATLTGSTIRCLSYQHLQILVHNFTPALGFLFRPYIGTRLKLTSVFSRPAIFKSLWTTPRCRPLKLFRDRFYKAPFRPITFRINFHSHMLDKFQPQKQHIKIHNGYIIKNNDVF
jgi:hypothetical protein